MATEPLTLHRLRANAAGTTTTARRVRLIAGANITLSVAETEGSFQVTIASSGGGGGGGAPTDGQYVVLTTDPTLTAERVLAAGAGLTLQDGGAGGNVTLSVAGGTPAPAGAQYVVLGLDATLTGERRLVAGAGLTIQDGGAGGDVTISSTGGGGGAPTGAQYVTLATDQTLTDERVLTAGLGLQLTDGGPGNPVTLQATTGLPAYSSTPDGYILALQQGVPAWVSLDTTGPLRQQVATGPLAVEAGPVAALGTYSVAGATEV